MLLETFSLLAAEGSIANVRLVHVEGEAGRSLWVVEFSTRSGSIHRLDLKRGGLRLFKTIDSAVQTVWKAGYRGDFNYSMFR